MHAFDSSAPAAQPPMVIIGAGPIGLAAAANAPGGCCGAPAAWEPQLVTLGSSTDHR